MSQLSHDEKSILDKQIAEWTKDLRHLASQIAAAKGVNCAVVLIASDDQAGQATLVRAPPASGVLPSLRVNLKRSNCV